jgi:2-keto-4-pentenoate hydratase
MNQNAVRDLRSAGEIAARLVSARLDGRALEAFPGVIPTTLEQGYAIQELALHLWPGEVAGWKIGLVPPPLREKLGATRVAGPIFAKAVREAKGEVEFPVFVGGFAAVEAEYVFRMRADAPAGKTQWTEDEAAALVGACHIGVETAGSPMAFINDLGPTVVASDFGNNYGLIVGPEVKDVGEGGAMSLPGGPLAGLTFLLAHLAERERPLSAGQYVSSGAVTGVHDIRAGESAVLDFGADGSISCRATPLKAGA